MRLIEADALIEALDSFILDETTDVHGDTVREILERLPTIEERKTGKWYKPNGVLPPEHFGRHRCSICDAFAMHDWKHHREQLTDYCPNCGSYMRGDKHETN